jgi:hypothetical protein
MSNTFATPLERILHISRKPCSTNLHIGGHPTNTIKTIQNIKNKYLHFDGCARQFTFDDNLNTKTDINGSKYLGKGGVTAVFSIKDDKGAIYILRIEDAKTTNDLNKFIASWTTDKTLFPKNIIEIHAYGIAMLDGVIIGTYMITNKYFDFDEILKLNLYKKNIFTKRMLQFIVLLKEHDIFYRDFKLENIGFDNDLNFIVLDYDDITLVRKNSPFFVECLNHYKFSNLNRSAAEAVNKKINICYGTFLPLVSKYNYDDRFKNTNYDKYYCLALADILLNIYATIDENSMELDAEIYSQSQSFDRLQNQSTSKVKQSIDTLRNTLETTTFYDTMVRVPVKGGGDVDVQTIYLNNLKNKINTITPNFQKHECEISNIYFKCNFYDNLFGFVKSTITNMTDLDANKIMTEKEILDCFDDVFRIL